ncbi:DEAD/DEAH box helicase family protein [Oceanimonas baumannii]|uniref:DEAD/DEAH box helicase family protein n=1 Tax=Oceanimonas baumannii TaxID=129578 RepID=UPI001D17DA69|nr:DEAD/DEAH box helicase family protein [Oceanimonas baumannii]MCC4266124.1 DEAD/DEAH box helicase family protein [Oceanimonas baumannii]
MCGSPPAWPLQQFHSPEGLLDRLIRSKSEAEAQLEQEFYGYLKLRGYQQKVIESVEQAWPREQRHCLLAMVIGTGKTRTIIGLMYRFWKAERFKRILFLVDRMATESEPRIQVATVQAGHGEAGVSVRLSDRV